MKGGGIMGGPGGKGAGAAGGRGPESGTDCSKIPGVGQEETSLSTQDSCFQEQGSGFNFPAPT